MHIFSYKSISRLYPEKKITKTHIRVFTTFNILTIGKDNLTTGLKTISKHRRYAQYTEGIETEAKTKQLEQLIIEE